MTPSSPKTFDWVEALARLAKSAQSAQDGEHLSEERVRAILEERAKLLARVPPRDADETGRIELLLFAWAGERFAIETKFVREVSRLGHVTALPGAPSFFVGLTNLRGEMLAVLDLRSTFGMSTPTSDASVPSSPLIVLGGSRPEFGLIADEVAGVEPIHVNDLSNAPAYLSSLAHDLVRGVTNDGLLVLNGHVALTDSRLFAEEV
jgi:purine-binding chemotaxis protein CheW